jgi:hypothetical protein
MARRFSGAAIAQLGEVVVSPAWSIGDLEEPSSGPAFAKRAF